MKQKLSITLSDDVVRGIDRLAGKRLKRSQVIEGALRRHLERIALDELGRRDLALLNEHADELNEETEEVLLYQVPT